MAAFGFQESSSASTGIALADPFTGNANFSIYGDANVYDSGANVRDTSAAATDTTQQSQKVADQPDSSQDPGAAGDYTVGPGTGVLADREGGSSLMVWVTVAGIVVAVLIALTALRKKSA
jgi:hypothetical protein